MILDTNWRWDDLGKLRTLQVGDAIAAPGWWGQAVRFGGVQFSSNYSLQPGFVTYPLLAIGGLATVPSTTEVLVNDVRIGSQNVPTGPFSITNIPTISGAGDLNLVVRDAFGQQRVISQPFYVAQQLLRPGLTEFSISAGAERRNYGIRNFDYGQGYASGYLRGGLTQNLTAEARAEFDGDGGAAGVGADVLVGQLGVVSAGAALSQVNGVSGARYLLGFDRQGRVLSFGARATRATSGYAEIGQPLPRVSSSSTAFFRTPLGNVGALSVGYTGQRYFTAQPVSVYTASFSRGIVGNAYLTLSLSHYASSSSQTQALALVTVPLDRLTSATASVQSTRNGESVDHRAEALLQRSLPIGQGFGYYARANTDRLFAGGVSYAGPYGRYTLEGSEASGTTALRASATGAVAWVGSDFIASQSIEQGFAIVRVADLGDVRVLQENQDVGRTRGGTLALTQIPALNPVKIAVDPVSVPIEVSLEDVAREVVLLPRTGVLIDFKATRDRTVLVKLVLPSGQPVPAGAIVTVDGRAESFPVGFDGEAFLTRATERQDITVRFNGALVPHRRCRGRLGGSLERRPPDMRRQAGGRSRAVKRTRLAARPVRLRARHDRLRRAVQRRIGHDELRGLRRHPGELGTEHPHHLLGHSTAARKGQLRGPAEPRLQQQFRATPHAARRCAARHPALQPLPRLGTRRAQHQRVGRRHGRDAGLAGEHEPVGRSADEDGHEHHRGRSARRYRSGERRLRRHGDRHHRLSLGGRGARRRPAQPSTIVFRFFSPPSKSGPTRRSMNSPK